MAGCVGCLVWRKTTVRRKRKKRWRWKREGGEGSDGAQKRKRMAQGRRKGMKLLLCTLRPAIIIEEQEDWR